MANDRPPHSEILLYEAQDEGFRMEVQTDGETVWLSQQQMAELFDRARSTINEHIQNVFKEGELTEERVFKKFGNPEFALKPTNFYNLEVIIAVGFRIKSPRGTQFRIWANERLREYLIKGFTMDDRRFKEGGGGRYFEELLQRIRDIRSSEKVFWRKVLDIFATSIDYTPEAESSKEFFAKIQNQLHWAAHGHTAAEKHRRPVGVLDGRREPTGARRVRRRAAPSNQIIYHRSDASLPNMGVTNFPGGKLLIRDTEIAKNYLTEEELNLLNRIVTAYLELAEIQAMNRVPMTMQDWVERLHQFLTMTGRDLLTHAGQISRDQALEKAHQEYQRLRTTVLSEPSEAEKQFVANTEKELKALEKKGKETP